MNTSFWGKNTWTSLFSIAMGYDLNTESKRIKNAKYKQYFQSVGDVLPCRYCRDSYVVFYNQLNIDKYLNSKKKNMLMKFVYDLKELVNEKLRKQEVSHLKKQYNILSKKYDVSSEQFHKIMRDKSQEICFTKATPTFASVVAEYRKHQASCSPHLKTCRHPSTKSHRNRSRKTMRKSII